MTCCCVENLLKDSFAVMSEQDSRFTWNDHSRSLVKFAEDSHDTDSDDEVFFNMSVISIRSSSSL